METVLNIQQISKKFKNYQALKDISFQLHAGEIIGFLGPSGSGKTTTIKIVTGQLKQTTGVATLLGMDSRKLSYEVFRKIGIVSDNNGVYEKRTVYENLVFYAKLLGIDIKNVDDLLNRVGMYEHRKKKAEKLSKGQLQRLVLVRALIHNPQILFLDEPTSGLDPTTTLEVHKLLLELRESGTAIFLTTHNMEEATKLCDRVALLNEGVIMEYGTPKELCMKYYQEKKVSVVLKDNVEIEVDTESLDSLSKLHHWFVKKEIKSIHSTEPNLEKVFLAVTGRELS